MKTAYLESNIKHYNLEQLQTGDLIKFQADVAPIIYHYGIIHRTGDNLHIYHNQATFKNRAGGGLIREDFKKYIKGRKIVDIEKTGLNDSQLSEMTEILRHKKYHWINNNCETFINNLMVEKRIYPQLGKWALGLIGIIGVIWWIKRK